MKNLPDYTFSTSRWFAAKAGTILKAIADPEIIAEWWGPFGFSNEIHEFDFQPGGKWILDMRGPDGAVYSNLSVFEEISPERIVIRHLGEVHEFVLEILIEAEGGGSRLTWNQTFMTAEDYKNCLPYVPRCNEEVLDRLELELAVIEPDGKTLVLRRMMDVPAERVFQGWTDPAMLVKWFTPPPYETIRAECDVRVGGSSLMVMRSPDGVEMHCPGVYLQIVQGRRIVSTDAYVTAWVPSDKPFMTLDLNFEDLGGKTKYTAIARHWTVEDKEAHEKMGFHTGWGIATDQLESLIKSLS